MEVGEEGGFRPVITLATWSPDGQVWTRVQTH